LQKEFGDGGTMKIFLIEDSKFQRMATERALVNAGYVVIQAGDGDEGLRMAREKTYRVTSKLAGFTRKRIFARVLLSAGVFAALHMLLWTPWPSSTHLLRDFSRAVISGVVFALLFVLLYERNLAYDVIVSDDCITAAHPWFERSVKRRA
jgi:CheY-like chemotaxis protein